MPKAGKSSASSGTRKKQAQKAAKRAGDEPEEQLPPPPKTKKGKKADKSAPRVKVFIPPVKPSAPRPDPLDAYGLAAQLPPDLVVILRGLGKKDAVTKGKALDELYAQWIEKMRPDDEESLAVVETMMPVWYHHYPTLVLHHSRRIRSSAAALHAALWSTPSIRTAIIFHLNEAADAAQQEQILGAWSLSAFDIEHTVATRARGSWDDYVSSLPSTAAYVTPIVTFLQQAIMVSGSLHLAINPPAPSAPLTVMRGGKKPIGGRMGTPVSRPSPKEVDERAKADADEEPENDRNARYRVGGMGVLKWLLETIPPNAGEADSFGESISDMLSDGVFWSSLYHGSQPPWFSDEQSADPTTSPATLGYGQPLVRRTAWGLLPPLARKWKQQMESILPVISTAVLRSAWVERDSSVQTAMWEPLLLFLTALSSAWSIDAGTSTAKDEESDSGSDDGVAQPQGQPPLSNAYAEFLDFLKLGCSGSPAQGYPVVIVVLSSIPPSILSYEHDSLVTLFASFWAAVDGRALGLFDRSAASAAFLSSLLECLVFLVSRIKKQTPPSVPDVTLVQEQFGEVWSSMETSRLKVDPTVAGEQLGKALLRLEDLNVVYSEAAWAATSSAVSDFLFNGDTEVPPVSLALHELQVLAGMDSTIPSNKTRLKDQISELVLSLVRSSVKTLSKSSETTITTGESPLDYPAIILARTVDRFSRILAASTETKSLVTSLIHQQLRSLVATLSPSIALDLVFASLKLTTEPDMLWHKVLETLGSSDVPLPERLAFINAIISVAGAGVISLPGGGEELTVLVGELVEGVLRDGSSESAGLLADIFANYRHFMAQSVVLRAVQRLRESVVVTIQTISRDLTTPLAPLVGALKVLAAVVGSSSDPKLANEVAVDILPSALVHSFCAPLLRIDDEPLFASVSWAQKVCSYMGSLSTEDRSRVRSAFLLIVHGMIQDVNVNMTSPAIVDVTTSREMQAALKTISLTLDDILPSRQAFETEYAASSLGYIATTDSFFDPELRQPPIPPTKFDKQGHSSYARMTSALLQMFNSDHEFARQSIWVIPHLVLLECHVEDYVLDAEEENAFFSPSADVSNVRRLRQQLPRVLTYAFSALMANVPDTWHTTMCARLRDAAKSSAKMDDPLADVLANAYRAALQLESSDVKDVRVFRRLLHLVLHAGDTTSRDTDPWLVLAQSIQSKFPQTCLSIVLTITQLNIESPRLDRLRNETASSLSAVPPDRANTEGVRWLRQLVALSPSVDSEAALLPQQRAVFLLQALQKWIASDEDLDEEIDSLLVGLCTALAPIIQSVSGAHWDFIFDLMESNLEASSIKDKSTYVGLSRTLELVLKVDELSATNKGLRTIWSGRRNGVVGLVAERVLEPSRELRSLETRRDLQQQLLGAAYELQVPLPEDTGFPVLCELLLGSSTETQLQVYSLLAPMIRTRNERLVVETAVESEQSTPYTLPEPILDMLEKAHPSDVDADEDGDLVERASSFLMAWAITLEFFDDISVKLRNNYTDSLKSSNQVEAHLLPGLIRLLGVDSGRKGFPMEMWAVDEFHLSLQDDSLPTRANVLAAHLYYRSLVTIPSLVRSWFQDRREKKLTEALASYTSRFFTPVIVSRELARLKDGDVAEDFEDDRLTIKVAIAVREVTAIFSVDDQPMEIGINFPSDFPLHNVGVRDGQKLGIPEVKWRAWLLNVQLVAQQTGSVVDALALWKRNISLHFEGEQECAICYSVISVSDRSLPKKPCNTCNNRFHASCLYKWFNTSHNSTCPLCRSNIL